MADLEKLRLDLGLPVGKGSIHNLHYCILNENGTDLVISGGLEIAAETSIPPQFPRIEVTYHGEIEKFDPKELLGRFTKRTTGIFEIEDYDGPAHRNLPRVTQYKSRETLLYAFLTYARKVESEEEIDRAMAGLVKKQV